MHRNFLSSSSLDSSILNLHEGGGLSSVGDCSFSEESQRSQSELGRTEIFLAKQREWLLDTEEEAFFFFPPELSLQGEDS